MALFLLPCSFTLWELLPAPFGNVMRSLLRLQDKGFALQYSEQVNSQVTGVFPIVATGVETP
ncbi:MULTISPECIES: hypothetical protein [unclassified Tolypothrix]|uniref:hypothetical protein n=1 Tax=unclassified Tolypothrix TaxID=2649714 RepID=UPI0005EABD39|nr:MULTISPECIES: hypothetical protein [unclassified Tolypothrix]BAY94287.1 hypothetical protein NIES3275_63330 [Microchaete diplosiphon NIES-3275]EKF03962.1 hypothetical protein FDUTEX481_02965 [Tolypothrix sp. PCC 7601]MBE9086559.1 hypothetical protein [Tolypothrix sp. LEGE 11397]UYD28023.1 hypothetical protein HGR01_08245 [Tolypothrix sp. PCC 7712]UYD36107.1 hypothetical protein HG267_10385 [Tolypothrix sp. PCC 7601]